MRKLSTFQFLQLVVLASVLGGAAYNFTRPRLEACQTLVLANVQKQHAYEAELGKAVNPDFLDALGGSK